MSRVEVPPAVAETFRRMKDRGTAPRRCRVGVLRRSVAGTVRRLLADDLAGVVRPWDLPGIRGRAATLGEVTAARVVRVDDEVLVAELVPGGERMVFRGVDEGWRLVRFAVGSDYSVRPETCRRVALTGGGPDCVLSALDLVKPDGVQLEVLTEELGQGETETRYRYRWQDGTRSVLAEEIRAEIYDGVTPATTCVRAVVVDGDRGVLLTGRDGSALVIEG